MNGRKSDQGTGKKAGNKDVAEKKLFKLLCFFFFFDSSTNYLLIKY